MSTPAQLLTTRDAAHLLGISNKHLAHLVRGGVVKPAAQAPGIRGAFFFTVEEVNRLRVARQAQKSKAGR